MLFVERKLDSFLIKKTIPSVESFSALEGGDGPVTPVISPKRSSTLHFSVEPIDPDVELPRSSCVRDLSTGIVQDEDPEDGLPVDVAESHLRESPAASSQASEGHGCCTLSQESDVGVIELIEDEEVYVNGNVEKKRLGVSSEVSAHESNTIQQISCELETIDNKCEDRKETGESRCDIGSIR